MEKLKQFIVKAKANGWVGAESGGKKIASSRLGSFDITFEEDDFFYQDSFVGLSDFCGQEHICYRGEPVWSQAYFGCLLRPNYFGSSKAVEVLKLALGAMYREGNFLGGFEFSHQQCDYRDTNHGDYKNFQGKEEILLEGAVVYKLRYFGGLVRK